MKRKPGRPAGCARQAIRAIEILRGVEQGTRYKMSVILEDYRIDRRTLYRDIRAINEALRDEKLRVYSFNRYLRLESTEPPTPKEPA